MWRRIWHWDVQKGLASVNERSARAMQSAGPFAGHHSIPLARPAISDEEVEAAVAVIRSGMLCQGEVTTQFESAFGALCEGRHAIAVSSGSAALLVALQALGVGHGDEVIAPDMTFISTATAAMYLGARPVLCDIRLSDCCMDPDRLEALITPRTKVIVPVHYAGQTAEMDPIRAIARRHGIAVLEDAAEAHLAR
jgi:dTDP-4-amino-4,6-dideoxygalactose transaminase